MAQRRMFTKSILIVLFCLLKSVIIFITKLKRNSLMNRLIVVSQKKFRLNLIILLSYPQLNFSLPPLYHSQKLSQQSLIPSPTFIIFVEVAHKNLLNFIINQIWINSFEDFSRLAQILGAAIIFYFFCF